MSSKPTFTSKELKGMSDEALAEHWSGWKRDTGDWYLTDIEVKRRQIAASEFRGWLSVVLSIMAVLISIAAIYFKQCNAP